MKSTWTRASSSTCAESSSPGNTTTRDKVIRRELVLEEGQLYNEKLWKISIQRLNQLGYFEQIKPDDPTITERHLDEKNGTVDLTLKLKEKGKNQIGLSGGVSGLSGSFIGLSYTTNNFLGLGDTLPSKRTSAACSAALRSASPSPTFLIARSPLASPFMAESSLMTRRGKAR